MSGGPADARKHFLRMVVLVVALDAFAVGVYYLAHVASTPQRVQVAYSAVWMIATVAIVGPGLRRIRQARYAARR